MNKGGMCLVILVNPKGSVKYANNAPMGLYYLSAMLNKAGILNKIFDLHNTDSLEELKWFLLHNNVLYAGITTCASDFANVINLAKVIKTYSPLTKIVLGGPFASAKPKEILNTFYEVDFICCGPGECSLVRLYQYLTGVLEIDELINTYYKNKINVVQQSKIEEINIDCIPRPSRGNIRTGELDDSNMFLKKAEVVGSRGCPYRCHFCFSRASVSQKWICRGADDIINEIEELINEHEVNCIVFSDSDFLASKHRAMKILRSINQGENRVKVRFATRSDSLLKLDSLEELFMLGCDLLEIGIESGSQSQLDRYGKENSIDNNEKVLTILNECKKKYKFTINVDMIMFDYEMNLNEVIENYNFIIRNNLNKSEYEQIVFTQLDLIAGSTLYEDAVSKGYIAERFDIPFSRFANDDVGVLFSFLKAFQELVLPTVEKLRTKIRHTIINAGSDKSILKLINSLWFLDGITFRYLYSLLVNSGGYSGYINIFDRYFDMVSKFESGQTVPNSMTCKELPTIIPSR